MPELPEVETMRRGILGVVGSRIANAEQIRCRLKPIVVRPRVPAFRRRVKKRRITQVDRIGKRVVIYLDSDDAIVFEPRMTGLVLVAEPPDEEHLRFRLDLEGGPIGHVWFWDRRGLGSVRLFSRRELERQLGQGKLGPDALSLAEGQLRSRLGNSRRAVKVALLDQRAVAGIGNLYASEILHVAGMHPAKRCDRLTPDDWRRVQLALVEVLTEAIQHEGSTLADGTYRNALNHPGGYQNLHRVYGRDGEKCETCGVGVVQRIVQAQRSTFFCPVCQATRRPPAGKTVRSR